MDFCKLRIIHYPDPRLRRPSVPVEKIDGFLADLSARMFELMYEANGLGLAAPQVGLNIRLFVTNHTTQPGDERVYVNPEILNVSGAIEREEGCLSVPEVHVTIRRAQRVRLRALGLDGGPFERKGDDLLARAWQHEMDHLNGILICDRMSPTAKIAARRQLKKLEGDFKKAATGTKRIGVP